MDAAIQYILYFAVLVVLAVPLGRFMAHIMDGEHTFLSPVIAPVERGVYRLLRIDAAEQMGCRRYLASVLVFSGIGLVALVALQALQPFLPGNPQHLPGVSWDLSFNTAASFITNTNWQSYSGETTLSYLVQFMGLTVQNFLSAGTGIAVMFALIRGFRQVKEQGLGSFWVDLTRTVLYVLIPLNLVFGICLAAGGVISNFQPAQKAELVEPVAVQPNADGGWSVIDGAQIEGDTVKVDGKVVEGARVVTEQFLPQGPAAPQVAIKQSGTNGPDVVICEPKTKAAVRTLILPPSVLKVMREYRARVDSLWMFPSSKKEDSPMRPSSIHLRLHRILDHAGCDRVRFHDLRHTFATNALAYGMDIKTLSTILGHVSCATTLNTYSHVTDEMRQRAAVKIDRGIAKAEIKSQEEKPKERTMTTFQARKRWSRRAS